MQIRWVPTLVILMVLSVMINAGFWQLERARGKNAALAALQSAKQAAPLDLNAYAGLAENIRYHQMQASGHYLSHKQFLLDNQILRREGDAQGRVGYDVLTPFQLDTGALVLVNRGWLPLGKDRTETPVINIEKQSRIIKGMVHIPHRGFRLGAMDAGLSWPRVIQYIDFEVLAQRLESPLQPFIIILNADEDDAYTHHWKAVVEGPQKHYSYAIQWFLMSVALIILAIRLNRKKDRRKND